MPVLFTITRSTEKVVKESPSITYTEISYHRQHIITHKTTLRRQQKLSGLTGPQSTTQDRADITDEHRQGTVVLRLNLQARKLAEQSLTETEESGKALSRVSTLPRTRPDMHEQSRSERPQSKQHARLILL